MTPSPTFPGALTLEKWITSIGRSQETAWRWIKAGMVKPENISGKYYITAEEDRRFWERVKAREFASETVSVGERVKKQVSKRRD